MLLVGGIDPREWRALERERTVVQPDASTVGAPISLDGLGDAELRTFRRDTQSDTRRYDFAIADCTTGFLWHCLFRLDGNRTPFAIAPRYNHVQAKEAFALLLSSQFADEQDVLFCGSHAASRAFGMFGFRCVPTYIPGIDHSRYRPLRGGRRAARRALGVDGKNRDVLVYAGRMAPDKHILELLDAFALIREHRNAELVLCVNFPTPGYAERCLSRAQEVRDVRVVEAPDNTELVQWYNAADVFVTISVSIFETFGRAPVESMACGTPPVVSAYSGLRETVTPDTGFVVPTKRVGLKKMPDVGAFADTVLSALSDRNTLEAKSAAAIIRARHYDMPSAVAALQSEMCGRAVRSDRVVNSRLDLDRYPPVVSALWESLHGCDIETLTMEFLRSGRLPVQPHPDAVSQYFEAWFADY